MRHKSDKGLSSPASELQRGGEQQSLVAPGLLFYTTVGSTGAAVMVVEILGTRVVGPVFGVSLFVWVALLAVTLSSLALGYFVGGNVVDRRPVPALLGIVTISASIALVAAVLLSRPLLSLALSLGPRLGPLVSALILFAPSLTCLGMATPIAVRLAMTNVGVAGHRTGHIYAMSTTTGLLATIVVSFYLIPLVETDTLLLGTAALLAINGAFWLSSGARMLAALWVLACPATTFVKPARALPTGLRSVERSQSPYSLLEVIDDDARNVRFLRADHSVIGAHFIDDNTGAFSFLHALEALRFFRPEAKSMLQIGLGTGALVSALQTHGIVGDVVEIDPEVVRLARSHFAFSTRGAVHVEDARTLLNRSTRQYDIVVHDTFTGGTTPAHLLSVEVLRRIKQVLRPGGVLALNFVGFDSGPHAAATWSVSRTVSEVFSHVRVYSDSSNTGAKMGNILFFASEDPLDLRIPRDAVFENEICRRQLLNLQSMEMKISSSIGTPISDARNPLARLQLSSADEHFRAMGELLPAEVWLP